MENNWAAENLQLIRTLMERSALYRRALAPVSLSTGIVGMVAGILGKTMQIESRNAFVFFWATTAFVALTVAFLIVRRQALQDKEPFWSPPTRRVAHALAPPLSVGSALILLTLSHSDWNFVNPQALPALWMALYGCALHAAGFFMARGIRWLGWIFVFSGCGLMTGRLWSHEGTLADAHVVMGIGFGGVHVAYGIYLYFTEKRNNAA